MRLRIAWYESADGGDSQMENENKPKDTNLVETNEWSYLRLEIMAPEKAKSARVRLILAAKEEGQEAQAYFDEIKLEKYEPTPTATPSPIPIPTNTPGLTPTEPPFPTPTTKPKPSLLPTKSQKQLDLNQLDQANDQPAVTDIDQLRGKIRQISFVFE